MLRQRLWTAGGSILVGWAVVVPVAYLLERFLLPPLTRWSGADWSSTIRLALNCLALGAAGWLIGRSHRECPIAGVLAFAATLTFLDLEPLLGINVPWLFRLIADAFHDSRYFASLASTAGQHLLLFVSLIGGALLSRPSPAPVSITE